MKMAPLVTQLSYALLLCASLVGSELTTPDASPVTTTPVHPSPPPLPTDVSECHIDGALESGPVLPILDEQFEMRVESKIMQGGYSADVIEYYDNVNNQGAVYRTLNGKESALIYRFVEKESFLIEDGKCTATPFSSDGFNFFNFTSGSAGGHIAGVNDLFKFGKSFGEKYMGGIETIRGIPVNHWASCLTWERYNTDFRMDYFFSKPEYATAIGKNHQIPVQLKLYGIPKNQAPGTPLLTYNHTYDFVFYRPGPIKDHSVFEVPQGVVCDHHVDPAKKQPRLPDMFSMSVESISPQIKSITRTRQYYDYDSKLYRLDMKANKNDNSKYGKQFGYDSMLNIIHDYNTGLEYIIDSMRENCTMRPIWDGELENLPPQDSDLDDHNHLIMKHGKDFFELGDVELKYQGLRTIRDVSCEVWAGQSNTMVSNSNTTVEAYYTQGDWSPSSDDGSDPTQILMGMWMKIKDTESGISSEYINHMFDYDSERPDLTAFDVRKCFDHIEEMKHFKVSVAGTYDSLVSGKHHHIVPAVRKAIAKAASVPPIRITNIDFEQSSKDKIDIWMTLLEKHNITGKQTNKIKFEQLSMEEAYGKLEKAINTGDGMAFTVDYDEDDRGVKHDLVMKAGSLKTDKEVNDPRVQPIIKKTGNSAGSMALLGIFMLVIGGLVGIGIGFYMWKRNSGFPYQVQH